jgi:hypothetical protein
MTSLSYVLPFLFRDEASQCNCYKALNDDVVVIAFQPNESFLGQVDSFTQIRSIPIRKLYFFKPLKDGN